MSAVVVIEGPTDTEVVEVGIPGIQGPPGEGMPTGGDTGQGLAKASPDDFDLDWVDFETPAGAQSKADTAQSTAEIYADGIVDAETSRAEAAESAVQAAAALDATTKANAAQAAAEAAAEGYADTKDSAHVAASDPHGDRANAVSTFVPLSQRGAALGVATLGADGLVPSAQIPPLAVHEFLGTVASQAAMLALSGQRGDVCIRTDFDPDRTYMLLTDDPTNVANWQFIGSFGGVQTVDGRSGVITLSDLYDAAGAAAAAQAASQPLDADLTAIAALDSAQSGVVASDGAGWIRKTYAAVKTALGLTKSDVGLGNVDNTSDANKPVSTAQAAADTAAVATAEGYADTKDAAHVAASDPHTGYQKETEKGSASGYAGLDASGFVPDAQLSSAIARDKELAQRVLANFAPADITNGTVLSEATRYNAFGFTDVFPDGTMVMVYRRANSHLGGAGDFGEVVMRTSADQGDTWTEPTVIFSEAGVDLRGEAGGVTPTGRLVVFITRYQPVGDTFLSMEYAYSDDQGATWSALQSLSNGSTTRFNTYGPLGVVGNKLIASWYGHTGATGWQSNVVSSSDDGATWSAAVTAWAHNSLASGETSFCSLGGERVLGIVRETTGTRFRHVVSTDGGATWNDLGDATFDTFSSSNNAPAWLRAFYGPNGRRYVACAWVNRTDLKLKVIFGEANALAAGPSGWDSNSLTELITGLASGSGYPSFVFPRRGAAAIGWCFNQVSGSAARITMFRFVWSQLENILTVDGAAAIGTPRTLGTGATQAAAGNDSRLSDARTPTAHHASHEAGGGDAVAITHAQTTGQTVNDHHNKSHAHDGADGSGTVAHSATTGKTANDHHNQSHSDSDHSDGPNAKANASFVTMSAEAGLSAETLLSALFASGTNASRPAAGIAGRIYQTTDNPRGLWMDTGSEWIAVGPIVVARTADSAARNSGNTGNTLTDDDTLKFTAKANGIYWVEVKGPASAVNATMDLKAGWNITATPGLTATWEKLGLSNEAGWWPRISTTDPISLKNETQAAVSSSFNGTFGFAFAGLFFNGSTAGDVVFQWAQNTSDAGNLKLLKGTFLEYKRLA